MNRRIRRVAHSLFGRLLISQIFLVAAVLFIAIAALTFAIRPIQRELTFRRLGDGQLPAVLYIRSLSASLPGPRSSPAGAPPTLDRLTRLLQEQADAQNIRTFLLNSASGTVLYDSAGQLTGATVGDRFAIRWRDRPPTARAGAPGPLPPPARGFIRLNDRRWLVSGTRLAVPRLPGSPSGGSLLLVLAAPEPRPLASVADVLQALPALPGLAVLAGLVALIGLLSVWLARSVSRSVDALVDGTRKIAEGELAHRVALAGSTPDELRTLAHSFNRMAEEVQRNRQAQRDFVANVSHDLRTPLTSIHGFSQALLDGTAHDPASQQRAVQIIHSESGRLNRLVNELIELTRLDSGRLQLRRQPLDLNEHLRWLVESFRAKAEEAGIHLTLQPGPSAQILADGDRLNRVFANLLENGLKFTPAGGALTVSVAARALAGRPGWEVSVTDTGAGIPGADLPYLFERFYQVDKARSGGDGSGLGLAIVRELVHAHRGEVGIESIQGLGSRFWVWLPRQNPSPD